MKMNLLIIGAATLIQEANCMSLQQGEVPDSVDQSVDQQGRLEASIFTDVDMIMKATEKLLKTDYTAEETLLIQDILSHKIISEDRHMIQKIDLNTAPHVYTLPAPPAETLTTDQADPLETMQDVVEESTSPDIVDELDAVIIHGTKLEDESYAPKTKQLILQELEDLEFAGELSLDDILNGDVIIEESGPEDAPPVYTVTINSKQPLTKSQPVQIPTLKDDWLSDSDVINTQMAGIDQQLAEFDQLDQEIIKEQELSEEPELIPAYEATDEEPMEATKATDEEPMEATQGSYIIFIVRMFILPIAVLAMLFSQFRRCTKFEESMIQMSELGSKIEDDKKIDIMESMKQTYKKKCDEIIGLFYNKNKAV